MPQAATSPPRLAARTGSPASHEQHGEADGSEGMPLLEDMPAGFSPCKCTRMHGNGPCEGITDRPSGLCQWCEENGSPDGSRCNCLCEACNPITEEPASTSLRLR